MVEHDEILKVSASQKWHEDAGMLHVAVQWIFHIWKIRSAATIET